MSCADYNFKCTGFLKFHALIAIEPVPDRLWNSELQGSNGHHSTPFTLDFPTESSSLGSISIVCIVMLWRIGMKWSKWKGPWNTHTHTHTHTQMTLAAYLCINTGELGYDGPLYDRYLHMTDEMLGPSPMHIKYSSFDRLSIWRTNFSWSHWVRHIQVHLY